MSDLMLSGIIERLTFADDERSFFTLPPNSKLGNSGKVLTYIM
jgi:hypothetical protein